MRSNSVKRTFCKVNTKQLPDDFFYKFLKQQPFKATPQISPKKVANELLPCSHTHINTPFEAMQQSSPYVKLRMLQAARNGSKSVLEGSNENSMLNISKEIIKNASDLQKENVVLKECKNYYSKRLCASKQQLRRKLRKEADVSFTEKNRAISDYHHVRRIIDTYGKSNVLQNITRKNGITSRLKKYS